jgi:hypothetical protein
VFNESALIKYGRRIVSLSRGKPAQVEFNWIKLLEHKLSLGKHFNPAQVGFYHVHPPGFATYSALDVECLKGFNLALGYPAFFCIILFDDEDISSTNHRRLCYRYINDQMESTEDNCNLIPRDLTMLKACSYAEEL